ncbi:MAG: hypothetical protein L0H41_14930 [Microlunatus sp.]|nr:hypothetical protein [Microlunatus sp.]MDN5769460.1 hypothetical protein [Microlunatus sp.]
MFCSARRQVNGGAALDPWCRAGAAVGSSQSDAALELNSVQPGRRGRDARFGDPDSGDPVFVDKADLLALLVALRT